MWKMSMYGDAEPHNCQFVIIYTFIECIYMHTVLSVILVLNMNKHFLNNHGHDQNCIQVSDNLKVCLVPQHANLNRNLDQVFLTCHFLFFLQHL